ncbi:MAG: TIGR02757 family protein [Desulfobacteraceae bacterium]|nr:TIGR02757 family protein [Desulfobacteraceae bacterium]
MSIAVSRRSRTHRGASLKEALESVYERFNRFECIHPDPLEFVYLYEEKRDREVAGLIASALAYGRVAQILCSVRSVLDAMGPSPHGFLIGNSTADFRHVFRAFKHRFTTGETLAAFLSGTRGALLEFGSLEACFHAGFRRTERSAIPALSDFVDKLETAAGQKMPMFLPSPSGGSACKRLNLFLRWMVRRDNVDPGAWDRIPASHLVVPLDTHMHRIALSLGLTGRKQADMRCAVEITEGFGKLKSEDPVRYDFALTRLGMNNSFTSDAILADYCFQRDY